MVGLSAIFGSVVAAITILAALLQILGYLPNIISFLRNPTNYIDPRKLLRDVYWIRRFWAPIVSDEEFIIVFPNREKKPSIPGLIEYDVKSTNILLRELTAKFSSVENQSITDVEFGSEHKDHHLITVAGPVSNKLTYDLLQTNDLPYAFEQEGEEVTATIVPRSNDEDPYVPDTIQSGKGDVPKVLVDYGIITRMKSPYDSDCVMINVAGGFGPGTFSGFELLTDPDALSRFCREGGDEYQVIYEVPLDSQGVIQTPEIINIEPINSSQSE
mgnify:CR=1 FL=1